MRRILIVTVALLGLGFGAVPASARTTGHKAKHSHVTAASHKKAAKKHHGRGHHRAKAHAKRESRRA